MTNIFDANPDDRPTIDENKDYVDELVGEGRKFKDISALARGKAEADLYVAKLKAQLEDLNKELNTRTSLDTFLEKMKEQREAPPPVATPVIEQAALDDSVLEARLAEILSRKEQARTAETNMEKVTRIMNEQFGDQASQVLKHRAQELDVSVDYLKQTARTSPEAFFRLTGVSSEGRDRQTPTIPISNINTVGNPGSGSVKNAAYWERLKRTDPAKYASPQTTVEMIQARKALGTKYYE